MVNKLKVAKKLRNKCFKIWTKQVKDRDHGQCCVCGSTERINAHHIVPRQIHALRFDVMNGCSLCPRCHRFSFEFSAHQNPFKFFLWLRDNRPEQFAYLERFINNKDDITSIKKEDTEVNIQKMKGGNEKENGNT